MKDLKRFVPYAVLALVVLATVVGGAQLLTRLSVFQIEEVEISGLKRVPESEVRMLLPVSVGENLFKVSLKEVRRRLKAHPWIKEVRVWRKLPNVLAVEVIEEEPIAVTVVKKKVFYVNEKGELFAPAPRSELKRLPVLSYESEEVLKKDADFLRVLSWIKKKNCYNPCYEKISQVRLGREYILVVTRDGLRIRFEPGSFEELKQAYRRLDRIMTYLYSHRLYGKARLIRLDYPEGTALLAYKEVRVK